MILKIRNSRTFKGTAMTLALSIFAELVVPNSAFALTGGPAQPEFSSFTPIGASDMVDLSSGDMSYNIPLMDVGGYPINIAYSSDVGMDDESSWVGLGWNLSVGQINRSVRGIPDDFNGDEMLYENYVKPNLTVGANLTVKPAALGIEVGNLVEGGASVGLSAIYNTYTGFSLKPSIGISLDLGKVASIGFNAESGDDGLTLSPNASLHYKTKKMAANNTSLNVNVGANYNSRQGLVSTSLGMTKSSALPQAKLKNGRKLGNESGTASLGSVTTYAEELYTPTKRVAMETESFTVNAAIGLEVFGVETQGQITAFGTRTAVAEKVTSSPAYGYANTDNAGEDGVLDFNREKDGSFSVNSTNMPLTNYTYDVYSVQGQGVGGMYRPYRNQVGYVYDTKITDKSTSGTIGVEVGATQTAHIGIDLESTIINSTSGGWINNNQVLGNLVEESSQNQSYYNPNYEKVHYKNVGDLSSDKELTSFKTKTGDFHPIRIPFSGGEFGRTANNTFNKKLSGAGMAETGSAVTGKIKRTERQARNQTINNLTFSDLANGIGYGPLKGNTLLFPSEHQPHHIAEVQIIRNDGARYVYGLPLYNNKKQEVTFAVEGELSDCNTGLVAYTPSDLEDPSNLKNDKYFNRITTPAYVHTHLLTSILSTDYLDRTGNGPTPDDFGSYTNFTYQQKSSDPYKWRVPFQAGKGTYNKGLETDQKDDQGNYVYGEKEIKYIHKIETKTHVAIFHVNTQRHDAIGVASKDGGLGSSASSKMYQLDSISLYSVGEYYDSNGDPVTNATPIKTVHFKYSYELCQGVPNNDGEQTSGGVYNDGGKLTLEGIYFTYRNSRMGKYTGYDFDYGFNPDYDIKGYDTWGNYLPAYHSCANVSDPGSAEFPYTTQNKTLQDQYASAWVLNKIKLPSGGEINLTYESDDYSHVQDKEAHRMYKVAGMSDSNDPDVNNLKQELYSASPSFNHYEYVVLDLDEAELMNLPGVDLLTDVESYSNSQIEALFLETLANPIYFRFYLNMTQLGGAPNMSTSTTNNAKFDYVTGYFNYNIENSAGTKIKVDDNQAFLVIPVVMVTEEDNGGLNTNPIAKAGWQFGRKYLNKFVYSLNPNDEENDIESIAGQLTGASVLNSLMEIINGPNGALEKKMVARRFIHQKSWIRLKDPDKFKLGGGSRVKEVRISDNWGEMTPETEALLTGMNSSEYNEFMSMKYGQSYSYTLSDNRTSGVATYEPIGNKENPFVQPVFSDVKKLLAPDEENYIEKPFGESFFPSPQVTYSKVTVSSLSLGTNANVNASVKKLHRTGKVITEFYTSRDYPTIVDQTLLQSEEDKSDLLNNILNLNTKKHFTASQGYVIHLNDMNGKQKSQRIYAEGQDGAISGVDYIYDVNSSQPGFNAQSAPNVNSGKLNNNVQVITPEGDVKMGTIGVEIDIVNDFRENKTKTRIPGLNTNIAAMIVGVIPIAIPIPLPDYAQAEDQFRSVSTTKVINTFGILRETIAYDAGAKVYTRNLAWDEATGEVLLTETIDEYNDKYYTFNYPAHWHYKAMGQAYKNLGIEGTLQSVSSNGYFAIPEFAGYSVADFFLPGDELIIYNGIDPSIHAWVMAIGGGGVQLKDKNGAFVENVEDWNFKVLRSSRRNLQSAGIMNVTLMKNPLKELDGVTPITNLSEIFLTDIGSGEAAWKIINAGAVEYSDNWNVSCECGIGDKESPYNPYAINERGVWRTKSSRTYLSGRNYSDEVTPRKDGYFAKFSPMYSLNSGDYWELLLSGWTKVAEVEQYSPYGFELENKDALNRYSAALYGYNNMFPTAVGANTSYKKIGFDGFEDHEFDESCPYTPHFKFEGNVVDSKSHSGRHSIKITAGTRSTLEKKLSCGEIIDLNPFPELPEY